MLSSLLDSANEILIRFILYYGTHSNKFLSAQILTPTHSGPDPLETIFVKIEKSLKNLQNASKSYEKHEFCTQLKHKFQKKEN